MTNKIRYSVTVRFLEVNQRVIPAPDENIRGQAAAGIQALYNNGFPTKAFGNDKFLCFIGAFLRTKLLRYSLLGFLILSCPLSPAPCPLSYAQAQTQDEKEGETFFVAKRAFEDNFYEVSLGLLDRFLKNYPGSTRAADANLLIAQCYFHQGKFLDALDKLEWLVNQPQAANIQDACFYWIAEVHFRGNNFSKAASYYKKIVEAFPNSMYLAAANYSLGWCFFQERDFAGALQFFKIITEKFPKESFAKESAFKILECLYNLKDYAQLKEKIKAYLKIYSKDSSKAPYLYFYLAEADYYLNNFSEAVSEYSKVLAAAQDEKIQGLSKLSIGWAYLKLKRYQEAESAFLSIKPDELEKSSLDALLLGEAILAGETNKFDEAKKIYADLLNKTTDPLVSVQAYLGRADAFYNTADFKEAIAVYKEALDKISPDTAQEFIDKLHYGLAWSYLKEGLFKEAIDEFQKIVKSSEDKIFKISAACQIGDAYQDSANFAKAIEAYDDILKNYSDSLYSDYVQYQLGMVMLKSSNYDGSILAFQSLKKNYPGSKLLDDATYALGLAYFQKEDYNSSSQVFAQFQQGYKDSYLAPQAMYLFGTSLYNLGKFNEAIDVFKNIIRLFGQDTDLAQKAEYEIADCFYRMGDEKEAMAKFKILRSKYPDSSLTAEVVWWLGEYYWRHNDLNLARRYFTSLIQDFPKSSLVLNAYYALGAICDEEENYSGAADNFQKVAALGKSDLSGTATVALADIYVKMSKLDLALEAYQKAIRDYPNLNGLIFPKVADIYKKNANFEEALKFYSKGLEIAPPNEAGSIQFKIAETKEAAGKTNEAIEEYLKTAYLYAQDEALVVKSLLRAASIYESQEKFAEAFGIYKRIIPLAAEEAKYAQERIDWLKSNKLVK